MSERTPIEPLPTRWLKSPFNGELWPVPPDLTPEMYDHMVHVAGFVPADTPPPPAPEKVRARR